MLRVGAVAILVAGVFVLAACRSDGSETPAATNTFCWHILQADKELTLEGDRPTVWPTLQAAYPTRTFFTLALKDVESYQWNEQVMTFTAEATTALIAALENPNTSRFPEIVLAGRAFVVALDEQPLYGGVFVEMGSPVVFGYPVAYVKLAGDKLTFTLRPMHPFRASMADANWGGIKDEKIEAVFDQAGKLVR